MVRRTHYKQKYVFGKMFFSKLSLLKVKPLPGYRSPILFPPWTPSLQQTRRRNEQVRHWDEIRRVWVLCTSPRHEIAWEIYRWNNSEEKSEHGWTPAGSHTRSPFLFISLLLGLGKRNMPKSCILPENRTAWIVFLAQCLWHGPKGWRCHCMGKEA